MLCIVISSGLTHSNPPPTLCRFVLCHCLALTLLFMFRSPGFDAPKHLPTESKSGERTEEDNARVHVVVLVHGYQGNGNDMKLFKNHIMLRWVAFCFTLVCLSPSLPFVPLSGLSYFLSLPSLSLSLSPLSVSPLHSFFCVSLLSPSMYICVAGIPSVCVWSLARTRRTQRQTSVCWGQGWRKRSHTLDSLTCVFCVVPC
jgi:hypothetical protein